MGSSQSIPSTSEITDAPVYVSNVKEYTASTKNGPKTKSMDQTTPISVTLEVESLDDFNSVVSAESDYSSDEDEDSDFDSDEEDEEMAERRMILEEARQLRKMAGFYHHPEAPVASDATACARCFFSRYSAPVSDNDELEDEAERKLILADAKDLKELAVWHMHPEKPVASTDSTAFGRNFFARASAPEYEDDEGDMEDERERILEEMKQLKTTAEWYMNPEKPVVVDSTTFGRNFFSRPSAPVNKEEEERHLILEEMKQLKMAAKWYMHPEAPVVSDPTACARGFFSRPSAPVNEEEEERERILEDSKELKTTADWYMHPEKPITCDPTTRGRDFFARPSASEYEDDEDDLDERDRILEEMKQLTTTAEWYMHPERPISVDAKACGRNYFTRPSAPEEDDADEREQILEEMKQLKTTAEWYMHPEKPVTVDAKVHGRNYFTRPSAPTNEEAEECETILNEMNELKTTADWYMHPEKSVTVDAKACGRSYFNRPSAPTNEEAEERETILEEMNELRTTADWYMHPEKPVIVDATASARSYFNRPSAPEEDEDDMEERERIMEDMKVLKMTAEWYMHPEKPVTTDPTACGRNFFSRPSAFDDDAGCLSWESPSKGQQLSLDFESNYTEEMEAERKLVLEEASRLKEAASWYLQPEKPIAVDSTVFGRNYFGRPSAPEQEEVDDIEERELILAEVNELKMVADWYRNPEKEVVVYATAYGRNYFTRPDAPEFDEDQEEREQVLADAAELLRVAQWYMHPEKPVTMYATATGRNFFSRPSAPEDDEEMVEERLRILADANQLKEVAGWYANPEQPVKSDGFATARNYFTRPSAPELDEDQEERNQVLADAKNLKEVAGWYANPEQPVKSDGFATARSYFTRPSAPEQEEEDSEEIKQVLADATELKKLAVDYLHPEKPAVSSKINCVRNFFDRASAPGHADHIHSEGYHEGDYVHHDFDHVAQYHHDYDHYHHHHDDVSHQSHQSHGDHFEMDEDFNGFRDSITAFRDSVVDHQQQQHIPIIKEEDDTGKEGNLSRSPSSIMLFDEQPAV